MRNILNLSEADFILPTEAFVQRCLQAAELTNAQIGAVTCRQLIEALRAGRTRSEVADALAHLARPLSETGADSAYNFVSQPMENFIVAETLTNFAPGDDAAFLAFAARKVLGREPIQGELLALEFDLRRSVTTRMVSIEWLVTLARAQGRHVVCEGLEQVIAPAQGVGFTVGAGGVMQFVAVRSTGNGSWEVAPFSLAQRLVVHNGGWKLHPGWVLTGPKTSFEAGTWLLELEFIQSPTARMVVDVVANSGLDVLFCQEFVGSVAVGIKLDIQASHKFLELRLLKPDQEASLCWILPRRIALARME